MFNLLLCLNQLYLFNKASLLFPFALIRDRFLFIRIPWSCRLSRLQLLFFSLESSFLYLIVPLVFFRSRFVHPAFSITVCTPLFPYFSNLPEIAFFLGHDRLYHRFPFSGRFSFRSRTVCFVASTLETLARFNFLGTLLLPVFTCFTRTAFYPQAYSISALSHLLKFLFFHLRFPERKIIIFFSLLSFPISGCVTFHSFLPITFSLDPLILSIHPFHLSIFFIATLFSHHPSSPLVRPLMFLLAP